MIEIREVDFETCKEMWGSRLWPGRTDIRALSSMLPFGGNDVSIYHKYSPMFVGLVIANTLIGVNSIHETGEGYVRSRGLWIEPEYRGNGYGIELLNVSKQWAATKLNGDYIWSLPKKTSWSTYKKAGFLQYSDWTNDFDFGPNAYALQGLSHLKTAA